MSRLVACVLLSAFALAPADAASESQSIGSGGRGSLRNGVSLPTHGRGFVTYSRVGNMLGRQYVHSRVRDTLIAAFGDLSTSDSTLVYVVGETGLKNGGPFRPHRTHQNGLSVDIFMPVRDASGQRALVSTAPWVKFGYALEFNGEGRGDGLTIDFPALAEMLVALGTQARSHGLTIERIIVAPEYVERVLAAGGDRLRAYEGRFLRRAAWVRHDEHVHVDFGIQKGTS